MATHVDAQAGRHADAGSIPAASTIFNSRGFMSGHDDAIQSHEPDPVVRAYLAGVDRTLIAKNLTLTPEERLRQLMALQQFADELQRAGREARSQ